MGFVPVMTCARPLTNFFSGPKHRRWLRQGAWCKSAKASDREKKEQGLSDYVNAKLLEEHSQSSQLLAYRPSESLSLLRITIPAIMTSQLKTKLLPRRSVMICSKVWDQLDWHSEIKERKESIEGKERWALQWWKRSNEGVQASSCRDAPSHSYSRELCHLNWEIYLIVTVRENVGDCYNGNGLAGRVDLFHYYCVEIGRYVVCLVSTIEICVLEKRPFWWFCEKRGNPLNHPTSLLFDTCHYPVKNGFGFAHNCVKVGCKGLWV